MNIILLIVIGISLSMDTFSLALSVGAYNINKKDVISLSFIVGLFHFIMPLLGLIVGNFIIKLLPMDISYVTIIVFLFIAIEMLIDLFNKEEKAYENTLISKLLFAFCVSIDSFSIGIGLNGITSIPLIGASIFMLVSTGFTFIGLNIGKYSYKRLGYLAKIIGIIIIILLITIHLLR